MAKFFRMFARYTKPTHFGVAGTALRFSAVAAFQEKDLKPVDKSLKLEDFQEKWSHKFVLQQSRQEIFEVFA